MNIYDLTMASSGAVLLGYLIIAVLLQHCHRRTGERLFFRFALAFYILASERLLLLFVGEDQPHRALIYVTRLIAFLIIIGTIWSQSRRRSD
jgi:hypothetical protein